MTLDIKTYVIAGLLLLLLVAGGITKYLYSETNRLNGDIATLEAKNKELASLAEHNAEVAEDMKKERDALSSAAAERKVQDVKDDKRWTALNNRLMEALKNAQVREWYATLVPADVDRVLDDEGAVRAAGGDQEGVSGSLPDKGDAGPSAGKESSARN